jgi:4-hydroxy-tetrahydrodipicolinate synthase
MVTPLTPHGDVDAPAILRLAEHLIAGGVNGIFVLGTSGEGPWLTPSQAERTIAATVGAVGGRVPVLAGVLEASTSRALEAAHAAEAAGADAMVVTSPYYYVVDAAAQRRHVEAIATATALPLVLYNIPEMTRNPFLPETVRRLIESERVIAIKDSAGDRDAFAQFLALRTVRPGFRVLQGAEQQAAPSLLAGADGLVPGLGNLVPDLFVQMVSLARADRRIDTLATQARVDALWQLHAHGFWLACLKYAASLLGFGSGTTCDRAGPLPPVSQAAIRRIVEQEVCSEATPFADSRSVTS